MNSYRNTNALVVASLEESLTVSRWVYLCSFYKKMSQPQIKVELNPYLSVGITWSTTHHKGSFWWVSLARFTTFLKNILRLILGDLSLKSNLRLMISKSRRFTYHTFFFLICFCCDNKATAWLAYHFVLTLMHTKKTHTFSSLLVTIIGNHSKPC